VFPIYEESAGFKAMIELHKKCALRWCIGGSLVTTAWRVLRFRMEETLSSFGR
jgi:hypothetical protein